MLDSTGLHLRAAFFAEVRRFFVERHFLEVDTPLRLPVAIPETNIIPVVADGALLQASPELCMKMVLAVGENRIFQICPCFRKGERGRYHAEEFTMLEWYRKNADYLNLMQDCVELVRTVAAEMEKYVKSPFRGTDLGSEWEYLSVADAFTAYSPINLDDALARGFFDEILVEHIEPHLGKKVPLFLYDYPVSLGSLARVSPKNSLWAERFELYINGVEIANGFSELADEQEQRQRFDLEITEIERVHGRKAIMPEKFLQMLPQMGEAAGIALGIDRLLMLAANKKKISEVQSFTVEEDFR